MNSEQKKTVLEIGSDLWESAKATGGWLGGALQGEFNNKTTLGQIVFDAVISMFPIVGEITAIRDLIAIVNRMVSDSKEVEKVINWIGIVLCLLPIIPIFGGILKGIGKLLFSVIKDVTKLEKVAATLVAFLRKMGYGDPIKYIDKLKFSSYQSKILSEFKKFINRLKASIQFFTKKMGPVLPKEIKIYLNAVVPKLDNLAKIADKMIPSAIKELDRTLNQVRSEIIKQMNKAGTKVGGGQTKVLTTEARLSTAAAKTIVSKGHKSAPKSHYRHKEGWPNLLLKISDDVADPVLKYYVIASFSLKANILPKIYKPGMKVSWKRIIDQAKAYTKSGGYWANKMPESGTAWRFDYAVKSGWSPNGAYVSLERIPTVEELRRLNIKVPDNWSGLKTWEGKVAEQYDNEGSNATLLLLTGGEYQIFIDFAHIDNKPVKEYIDKVLEMKKTNWKDVNLPKDIGAVAEYLAARELSKKTVQQGQIARNTSIAGRANNREHN